MKLYAALIFVLSAALGAEDLSPTASAEALSPAASAVEISPAAKTAVGIMLKDGQKAHGFLTSYDAFYMGFESDLGRKSDIPWKEVAEFKPDEFSGDTSMIRQYLNAESAPVTAVIQAKDLGTVTSKAFWPGILIHGAGYREAGDSDMFLSLAGAEIFGALVGGFGASKFLDPGVAKSDRDAAQYLVMGGGGVFVASWLVDLAFSRFAAKDYNKRHGFSLAPRQGGAAFALSF